MTRKRQPIPQGVRFNVLRRDNFTCRYCGRGSPEVELHLDHVQVHSKGGPDTEANLVTACRDCNVGRGVKDAVLPDVVRPPADATGMVGLYGHTYSTPEGGGEPRVRYQFKVIRSFAGDRYAVQLFSFLSGDPTDIEVWSADELAKAKLYETVEAWHAGYERAERGRGGR